MLHYATFVTGLHEPVAQLITANNGTIVRMLDGAVVFEAPVASFLPCFHNVYEILTWEPASASRPVERFMEKLAGRKNDAFMNRLCFHEPVRYTTKAGHVKAGHVKESFRIVTSEENKLVSVNRAVKTNWENWIAKRTGMAADRGGSGYEYWFLYRSEGLVFFMKRLTSHTAYEKTLKKGELRPELAFLLNYLSEPDERDIMLDPFCGTGSIPAARVKHFPCQKIYASDIADKMTNIAREITGITCRCLALADIKTFLPEGGVTKIVTDPPWGLYDTCQDTTSLYREMLEIFVPLIKSGGIIVLLTSQKDLLHGLLSCPETGGGLVLKKTYDILVSGKKAGVFVISRRKEGS